MALRGLNLYSELEQWIRLWRSLPILPGLLLPLGIRLIAPQVAVSGDTDCFEW